MIRKNPASPETEISQDRKLKNIYASGDPGIESKINFYYPKNFKIPPPTEYLPLSDFNLDLSSFRKQLMLKFK